LLKLQGGCMHQMGIADRVSGAERRLSEVERQLAEGCSVQKDHPWEQLLERLKALERRIDIRLDGFGEQLHAIKESQLAFIKEFCGVVRACGVKDSVLDGTERDVTAGGAYAVPGRGADTVSTAPECHADAIQKDLHGGLSRSPSQGMEAAEVVDNGIVHTAPPLQDPAFPGVSDEEAVESAAAGGAHAVGATQLASPLPVRGASGEADITSDVGVAGESDGERFDLVAAALEEDLAPSADVHGSTLGESLCEQVGGDRRLGDADASLLSPSRLLDRGALPVNSAATVGSPGAPRGSATLHDARAGRLSSLAEADALNALPTEPRDQDGFGGIADASVQDPAHSMDLSAKSSEVAGAGTETVTLNRAPPAISIADAARCSTQRSEQLSNAVVQDAPAIPSEAVEHAPSLPLSSSGKAAPDRGAPPETPAAYAVPREQRAALPKEQAASSRPAERKRRRSRIGEPSAPSAPVAADAEGVRPRLAPDLADRSAAVAEEGPASTAPPARCGEPAETPILASKRKPAVERGHKRAAKYTAASGCELSQDEMRWEWYRSGRKQSFVDSCQDHPAPGAKRCALQGRAQLQHRSPESKASCDDAASNVAVSSVADSPGVTLGASIPSTTGNSTGSAAAPMNEHGQTEPSSGTATTEDGGSLAAPAASPADAASSAVREAGGALPASKRRKQEWYRQMYGGAGRFGGHRDGNGKAGRCSLQPVARPNRRTAARRGPWPAFPPLHSCGSTLGRLPASDFQLWMQASCPGGEPPPVDEVLPPLA